MVGGVFCLQAEGGIRCLVRSRGLGDVYKREGRGLVGACFGLVGSWSGPGLGWSGVGRGLCWVGRELVGACSYTHLRVPTILRVEIGVVVGSCLDGAVSLR